MSIGARIGLVLVVIAGLAAAVIATTWRDHADVAACTPLYAAAKTASDTARVDLMVAPRLRGQNEYSPGAILKCGDLRRRSSVR